MELKIFPWDRGEKPYWINPENGLEWYFDKDATAWCQRDTLHNLKKLNAVVFYVTERKDGEITPLNRVLIDKETNEALAYETSLEAMACKIDILRVSMS